MVENRERRDLLRDTAIGVLAREGAHRLTHRRVDQEAGLPTGTTKNYFPTRDALLRAAAERCYQRYLADLGRLDTVTLPAGREDLTGMLAELIRRGTGPDRVRLLATLELHAEATRNTALRSILAELTRTDFEVYDRLQRAAGLPVTPARSRVFARCVHAALLSLLTHPPEALRSEGLADLEGFVAEVVDTVYPR